MVRMDLPNCIDTVRPICECPTCVEFRLWFEYYNGCLNMFSGRNEEYIDFLFDKLLHRCLCRLESIPKCCREKDGTFHYEITLTTTRDKEQLENVVKKILKRRSLGIIAYKYCVEYTKEGMPHIHMYVVSSKYIRAAIILKMNKGDRVEVSKVRSKEGYNKYVMKESDEIYESENFEEFLSC